MQVHSNIPPYPIPGRSQINTVPTRRRLRAARKNTNNIGWGATCAHWIQRLRITPMCSGTVFSVHLCLIRFDAPSAWWTMICRLLSQVGSCSTKPTPSPLPTCGLTMPLAAVHIVAQEITLGDSILELQDVLIRDRSICLVQELMEGCDAAELLLHSGQLSADDVVRLLCTVLRALRALHENGIVHRDLKLANVLLPGNCTCACVA